METKHLCLIGLTLLLTGALGVKLAQATGERSPSPGSEEGSREPSRNSKRIEFQLPECDPEGVKPYAVIVRDAFKITEVRSTIPNGYKVNLCTPTGDENPILLIGPIAGYQQAQDIALDIERDVFRGVNEVLAEATLESGEDVSIMMIEVWSYSENNSF